jgi:transposase
MRQQRAAELLGLGVRQVKRLVSSYRRRGDRGPVSGRRGRPSNNRLAEGVVGRIEMALRAIAMPTSARRWQPRSPQSTWL